MGEGSPAWLAPALGAGALIVVAAEAAAPLRRPREPFGVRLARNLTLGGLGFATLAVLQAAIVAPVLHWTVEHRFGLLGRLAPGSFLRAAATFLLLDYTLWIWHFLNHRAPFFWRFHRVHHVDRDMDASTGVRFHAGELALSSGFRMAQIVLVGADPFSLLVWQAVLFVSVLFHHSNTRLPVGLERLLVKAIVTPRMHGIHHSDYRGETDSNWSSILSVWDYLHRTVRLDVPTAAITTGVAGYQRPEDVTIGKVLVLPVRASAGDWKRPDGSSAERPPLGDTRRLRA